MPCSKPKEEVRQIPEEIGEEPESTTEDDDETAKEESESELGLSEENHRVADVPAKSKQQQRWIGLGEEAQRVAADVPAQSKPQQRWSLNEDNPKTAETNRQQWSFLEENRKLLEKNLEQLLLNKNHNCKDVIAQLAGNLTPKQVQKMVEKTQKELGDSSLKQNDGIMKKNSCSECGHQVKMRQNQFWTPQTHRKSHYKNRKCRQKPPEMIKSMVFSHKQKFYSPQLQRRKSEDYSYYHETFEEVSSESEEEQKFSVTSSQLLKSAVASAVPSQQYYGGVHPVYLPNNRSKAQKLQKMAPPVLESPSTHSRIPGFQACPPGIQSQLIQHCHGCCHQHKKSSGDDKKCIIS